MALLPINKIEKIKESEVKVQQIEFQPNTISGDVIDGGQITNFNLNNDIHEIYCILFVLIINSSYCKR